MLLNKCGYGDCNTCQVRAIHSYIFICGNSSKTLSRMCEHTCFISSYQLLITAVFTHTGGKMNSSRPRAADRCPFVPGHIQVRLPFSWLGRSYAKFTFEISEMETLFNYMSVLNRICCIVNEAHTELVVRILVKCMLFNFPLTNYKEAICSAGWESLDCFKSL